MNSLSYHDFLFVFLVKGRLEGYCWAHKEETAFIFQANAAIIWVGQIDDYLGPGI